MTAQPQPAAAVGRGGGRWEAISLPVSRTLTFIRFSHTVFAMPFALGAMLAASHGRPGWRTLGLIVLSMVCARTAAMTFNRWPIGISTSAIRARPGVTGSCRAGGREPCWRSARWPLWV